MAAWGLRALELADAVLAGSRWPLHRATGFSLMCLLAMVLLSACTEGPKPATAITDTPSPNVTSLPESTRAPPSETITDVTPTLTQFAAQPAGTPVLTDVTRGPSPTSSPPNSDEGRDAADYTEEEIAEVAASLMTEFVEAVSAEPERDLKRARAIYSEVGQPDDFELWNSAMHLLWVTFGKEFSVDVVAATRLPGHDDAAIVLSFLLVDGERAFGPARRLIAFENGRWLISDCEEGRALFPQDMPDDALDETLSGGPQPRVPTPIVLVNEPGDHTDEEIARSVEWLINDGWRATLQDPEPDFERMRAVTVPECRTETDEELMESANWSKQFQARSEDEIREKVVGVERIDDHRAWVTVTGSMDYGYPWSYPPSLVVFQNGQWRDAQCLVEGDSSLEPRALIEPDLRVSYVREPVRVQFDWEMAYELTVIGVLKTVDDMSLPFACAHHRYNEDD